MDGHVWSGHYVDVLPYVQLVSSVGMWTVGLFDAWTIAKDNSTDGNQGQRREDQMGREAHFLSRFWNFEVKENNS